MIGVIEHKMALLTMICGKYIDKTLLVSKVMLDKLITNL